MASYKLNVAKIQGCPPPPELGRALEEFALPAGEEFGVLNHAVAERAVYATIVRRTQQAVQAVDAEAREVTSRPVERVNVYPFAVRPGGEILEIYAGGAGGIEQVGLFFSSCLALPVVVEAVELDIPRAIDHLSRITERFRLVSIRVSEYAHNAYMSGVYAPKFLDTQHGVDFLDEYAEHTAGARVRFAAPSGRVNVNLRPRACFSFSCAEEDQAVVQSILLRIV